MGDFSIVFLLFGSGKISGLMGDLANGIMAFRKTMTDDVQEAREVSADKPDSMVSADPRTQTPRTSQVRDD